MNEDNKRIRIAFETNCLRTKIEWQKHKLSHQRRLLQMQSSKVKAAEQKDDAREEQQKLLRGFRKIITRELGAAESNHRATVFIVERRDELRTEMEDLCRILEYPIRGFKRFTDANRALQERLQPSKMQTSGKDETNLLYGRPGNGEQDWRSLGLVSTSSSTSATVLPYETPIQVFLLGFTCLEESMQPQDGIIKILAIELEDLEDLGRLLMANGEDEIREKLQGRGIIDYLIHPLSLHSLQSVIGTGLRRHFGQEYLLVQIVGRGTSGMVHEAKRLQDGETFALKEINTRRLSRTAKQDVERETKLLQELSWPTVVFVVDAWESPTDQLRFLLMPFLKGGTLLHATEAAAEPELVTDWYVQTLHGLCYLHWRGVLHRDLKPGNILLADGGRALQIGDLGSAALLPGPGPHPAKRNIVRGTVSTPAYASPEVLVDGNYMTASDIWSVGASFYEVLTLKPLIPSNKALAEIKEIVDNFDPDHKTSNASQNLAVEALAVLAQGGHSGAPASELMELLHRDPLRRPTAAALASRAANKQRLRSVLAKFGALPEKTRQERHLDFFARIVTESDAAADMPAPEVGGVQESRPRRRRARGPHAAAHSLGNDGTAATRETALP
mmetsp:Transcript_130358/g.253880  ORF Transcript_130358/g.253880 Transcript_130358/m.253880 type:complete len:616 (+) Transcript_130358:1215-3062(+)